MIEHAHAENDQNANIGESHDFVTLPSVLMFVTWTLIIFTFSMPDRFNNDVAIDVIAKLKVAARAVALAVLLVMLLWQWSSLKLASVIRCLLPLGLFVAWGILSVLWSPLKLFSIGQIVSFSVLVLLAANIALYWNTHHCTSKVFLHLSLVLLVFGSALTVASVIFPDISSVTRSEESLVHSTMAGANASLGIILLLGARLVWGWRWSRYLLVPGLVIHGYQLYSAHSRTAIAATLVACCLLQLMFVRRQVLWAGAFLICFGAVSYLILDPGFRLADALFTSGAQFAERDEYSSISNLSGRAEMWETMWQSYLEAPCLGHGYFVSSRTGLIEVWNEIGNWTAHNIVMQVLVSTGAIGMVLLMWAMWRPVRTMCSTLYIDGQNDMLLYFLFVLGSWFFIWGLMNESFVGPLQPESVVFFTMLGLGIGSALNVAASPQMSLDEETLEQSAIHNRD